MTHERSTRAGRITVMCGLGDGAVREVAENLVLAALIKVKGCADGFYKRAS